MSTPTRDMTLHLRLSESEYNILEYIYKKRLPTGICFVSYKLLTKELDVSKKTLHKAIKSLISKGFLKRVRKGYYALTDKAVLYLETSDKAGHYSPYTTSPPPQTSPLTFLLSGIIGFEVLERWSKRCFLFYRPHNVRIRIPLLSLPSSLACKGTINSPFGRIHVIIPKDLEEKPFLYVELLDHVLIRNERFADVVNYVSSLPYKIASWLERNYNITVDYDKVTITHVALGVVVNPKEVPEDIINKLVSLLLYQNVDAKKSLYMVDKSVGYPEIELETDDVNKLYEVLIVMFPLTLIEFIKKDLELDQQILDEIKEIKEMLKELKIKNTNP